MTDYYVIRARKLHLTDIYDDSRTGLYYYTGGVHVGALLAVAGGILPSLPGFLADLNLVPEYSVTADARKLNDYSWLVSFLLASILYVLLWKLTERLLKRRAFEHAHFADGDDKAGTARSLARSLWLVVVVVVAARF
jgi:cytosine/uracil/thiamine/allantoin permease